MKRAFTATSCLIAFAISTTLPAEAVVDPRTDYSVKPKIVSERVPDYNCRQPGTSYPGCEYASFGGELTIIKNDTLYRIEGHLNATCSYGRVELWKNGYHRNGDKWYKKDARIVNRACGDFDHALPFENEGNWDSTDQSIKLQVCVNLTIGTRHCSIQVTTDMLTA